VITIPRSALIFPLLGLLSACGGEAERPTEGRIPAVEAVPARTGALPLTERLSGTVRASNQVSIRPEIEARVLAVLAQSGQTVKAGDPLVRLDDRELQDQLLQATASLRLARASGAAAQARVTELEAEVSRSRTLSTEGLISKLEVETQEARLLAVRASAEQARAAVDEAAATVEERRSSLAKTVIRSPVSGRVGQRGAEVGMLVNTSTILFEVGGLGRMRVEIPLTGEMLDHIRAGQRVRILTTNRGADAETGAVEAKLSRISPFLDPANLSTVGEIDVDQSSRGAQDNRRLNPGGFVTVEIFYGESGRATLVPSSALWEDPRTGTRGVYVLKGAEDLKEPDVPAMADAAPKAPSEKVYSVELRKVTVIAEGRGVLGIEGVKEGEWVVTVGQQLLARNEGAAQEGGVATPIQTRVRAVNWPRVLALQGLQREDLLADFLEKQQRLGRERGAKPPSNEEFLRGGDL